MCLHINKKLAIMWLCMGFGFWKVGVVSEWIFSAALKM
jgi:hypothetical protein